MFFLSTFVFLVLVIEGAALADPPLPALIVHVVHKGERQSKLFSSQTLPTLANPVLPAS